ncbi:MAG: S-layer protein [Candidatus Micrarchaeota archaeon]
MKGINLRKIGAIVAGSAILASSVAFAGLVYQNTPLVDANGQPVVKIVVGEAAKSSDGVVAAYIASKIANEAYKSSTLTAQVVGEGTCTGGTGTGSCSVVAGSEKVELQVTVPGAGAADIEQFSAAIGDYLDRELENRFQSPTDTDEAYTVLDVYDDPETNPYQNHLGDYYLSEAGSATSDFDQDFFKEMVLVGEDFGPFAAVNVKPAGAGTEIKETQYFTFNGWNHWDGTDHKLYNDIEGAGYGIIFDPGGDYGLPLCPGDDGNSLDDCADTDELPAHKVFIKFLGEDWIISEVTPVTNNVTVLDTETYRTDGSKMKLAKEARSGIINVGEVLDSGTGYKVRLDDISREVGVGNDHPAIITVLDSNDNEICQDQVWPGDTADNLCDTTGVKLHVYQTAPGVLLIAKWAEMGIFSDEIEIEDGMEFIEDSDSDWNVAIGWSNKAPSGGEAADPEYLRTIILYNDEGVDDMDAGDKFEVVDLTDYHKFDLTYNGIDDENAQYDTLKYKYEGSFRRLAVQNGTSQTCYVNISKAYKVTSSGNEMFRRDGTLAFDEAGDIMGIKRGSELWFLYNDTAVVTDTCGTLAPMVGDVILKDGDGKYWYFPYSGPLEVEYRQAGSDGGLWFYNATDGNTGTDPEMWLVENAGDWKNESGGQTFNIIDGLGVYVDPDDDRLYDPFAADDERIGLQITEEGEDVATTTTLFGDSTLGYESGEDYESKFVSLRGTQFTGASNTGRDFKVPKSLLDATYTFATTAAETAEPDTTTLVLGEGDEATIGTTGVKVKVVEITEELTPCTFGTGAGAPTCDLSGVSAVIMPNNAPTVTAVERFALTSNMVVLDSEATALDTGTIVTVGGDQVNTVTADAIAGSGVDFQAQPVVVRAIGNKIVVAGLTAEDTITAGQQFVAGVTRT